MDTEQEYNLCKRIFDEEHSRYKRYQIHYFIPHDREDAETETLFLAYWPGILATSDLIELALSLPFDVRELKSSRKSIAIARGAEFVTPSIFPIMLESLLESPKFIEELEFIVVLSNDYSYEQVERLIEMHGSAILHISTSRKAEPLTRIHSAKRFEEYIAHRTADLLNKNIVGKIFFDAIREVLHPNRSIPSRIYYPGFQHGITSSNELIAMSIGANIKTEKELNPTIEEEYPRATVKSCKALISIRKYLFEKVPIENHICITSEPIIWRLYRADIDKDLFSYVSASKQEISAMRSYVKATRKFDGFIKKSLFDKNSFRESIEGQYSRSLISIHRQELRTFNIGLAVMHSGSLSPILRLNPKINKIKGDLINLANCSRGNGPHLNFKICKLAYRTQNKLNILLDPIQKHFINAELKEFTGVSLIGDIPFEWIPIRNLPMTLRCDVSRIPATPGNVCLTQNIRNKYISISISDLSDILIVRSFSEKDPIKYILERAIRLMASASPSYPSFKFVDVSSPEEFVEAVNTYAGALMIFDGHGAMDSESAVGSIIVGKEQLDVWTLRKEIQMPPIVLLSACDTLPIDGGHGSSANAFLALGAMTVLATGMPVNAIKSATFLSRLLFRISELLPIVVNKASYMPWRSFMSGMLRMTFCTDLIDNLINEARIISEEHRSKIQMLANMEINSLSDNWYENIVSEISKCADLDIKQVEEKCRFWGAMVDTLKYIQLGRPEKIRLRSKNLNEAISVLASAKNLTLEDFIGQ